MVSVSKKMLFIYNPKAGKGQIKNKLAEILDIFTKGGYEITVYPTQAHLDALNVVKEKSASYDLLVCSGGDGTLDEVVSGMMMCQKKIPIGYLPTGSTNDFANSLKISKNIIKAAQTVVDGQPFPCDIGMFNGNSFVYIAAFGIFTDVSYQTKQEMKNVLGHLAYVLEGMKRLATVKSYWMHVEHDGVIIEDEFIYGMITNSISVGGFKNLTDPNVLLNDGLFEVTLIKRPKTAFELQEIIAALLLEEVNTEYMLSFKTSKLKILSSDWISWTLDGEFGGEHNNLIIENNHEAISFIIPPKKRRKIKRIAAAAYTVIGGNAFSGEEIFEEDEEYIGGEAMEEGSTDLDAENYGEDMDGGFDASDLYDQGEADGYVDADKNKETDEDTYEGEDAFNENAARSYEGRSAE